VLDLAADSTAFDAPIKACDMAWNLIAENNKKAEL